MYSCGTDLLVPIFLSDGFVTYMIQIFLNLIPLLSCSSVDKAHLKLASAKAILRLSRYWENKIPAHVFQLALRTVEVGALDVIFCLFC